MLRITKKIAQTAQPRGTTDLTLHDDKLRQRYGPVMKDVGTRRQERAQEWARTQQLRTRDRMRVRPWDYNRPSPFSFGGRSTCRWCNDPLRENPTGGPPYCPTCSERRIV